MSHKKKRTPNVEHDDDKVESGIKKWKIVGVSSIAINVFLIIWTLVATSVWFSKHQHHSDYDSHIDEYCTPIGRESRDGCEEKSFPGGGKFCCSNDTITNRIKQHMNTSFRQQSFIARTNNYMPFCPNGNRSMPAARVVGPKTGFTSNDLQWDDESVHSFINETKYISGRFIINKAGFYYVYSQVTFLERNTQSEPSPSVESLTQTVWRQRQHRKDMVLHDIMASCKLQTGDSNSTSFVGAAFRLLQGDELMVTVSNYRLVQSSEYSNFFGLHMI